MRLPLLSGSSTTARSLAALLAFTLWGVAILCTAPAAQGIQQASDTSQLLVEEVREHFTINGQPIHPFVFRDLEGWISDSTPIITAIDVLAGDGSNYYSQGRIQKTGGGYRATTGDSESYSYSFVGSLDNGLLAVISYSSGGGSGIFVNLHFLDLFVDKAFDRDGNVYERINLKSIRQVGLGDRWREAISIDGNAVVVGGERMAEPRAAMRIEATRP